MKSLRLILHFIRLSKPLSIQVFMFFRFLSGKFESHELIFSIDFLKTFNTYVYKKFYIKCKDITPGKPNKLRRMQHQLLTQDNPQARESNLHHAS